MYCWGCELVQPLWKTVWRFPIKLKIEVAYDPAMALLGTYVKKINILTLKYLCIPMFFAAVVIIAEIRKQFKFSWMNG